MDIPGGWKQKDGDDKEGDEEGETSNSSSIAKKENIKAKEKLVSLNPLPPESLVFRSSSEREKSSDPTTINETDSGASSNADVEDNLEVNTNQCLSAQLNTPLKV